MSKKQGKFQKTLDFLAGKGFYLILALCVTAIGISGYMLLFGGDGGGADPDTQLNWISPAPDSGATVRPTTSPGGSLQNPTDKPDGADVIAPVTDMPTLSPSPNPPPTNDPIIIPVPSPNTTPSVKPAANLLPDFIWPVNGTVVMPHSPDDLVFNPTMGDWRVHLGLDIETAAQAKVMAAADGKVLEIGEDERMGTFVVLDHGGGYTTRYYNLMGTVTVLKEQRVKAGDVIGTVGASALWESGLDSHLHFEVWKDDAQVDPEGLLPAR